MSLSHGRPCLAISGPPVVTDQVLQAMHQPSSNIYASSIERMVLATGLFGLGWAGIATGLGLEVIDHGNRSGIDLMRLEAA
ncbi:hypothetical protein [Profundibacter sp.]